MSGVVVKKRFLSLGAGVQSTVIALMVESGELPPIDAAIFADTGFESESVYETVAWLRTVVSFPIYTVSGGNIERDYVRGASGEVRFAPMPLFLSNGGMGRRGCTSEYKIKPVLRKVRELCGLSKGRRAKGRVEVEQLIGITTDEMQRIKEAGEAWVTNVWPLIDKRMSRGDCLAWFARKYPGRRLSKSSCLACPYHDKDAWSSLTESEFERACEFDEGIRVHKGMRERQFVHQDRIPLREVDLRGPAEFGQISMIDECDGFCGT